MWEKEWWQSAHVCSLYTVWSICILLLSLLPPNPIRKYCAIVQNMSITPTRGGPFKKLQKQYLCNLVVENPLLYPIWKLFMSPFIYTISGELPSVCVSGLIFLPHWGTWGLGCEQCDHLWPRNNLWPGVTSSPKGPTNSQGTNNGIRYVFVTICDQLWPVALWRSNATPQQNAEKASTVSLQHLAADHATIPMIAIGFHFHMRYGSLICCKMLQSDISKCVCVLSLYSFFEEKHRVKINNLLIL